MKLLKWLSAGQVGMSSKTIALTALGEMPDPPSYPHDGDDFGRCWKLLALCPDAQAGLDRLGREGGDVWKALVPRWKEIEVAYLHDMGMFESGNRNYDEYKCYKLMQSIIRPAESCRRSSAQSTGK